MSEFHKTISIWHSKQYSVKFWLQNFNVFYEVKNVTNLALDYKKGMTLEESYLVHGYVCKQKKGPSD